MDRRSAVVSGTRLLRLFVGFQVGDLEGLVVVVDRPGTMPDEDHRILGLRLVEEWTLGDQGQAFLPLTPGGSYGLEPGEYRVEIYVDSVLVQEASFTIPE